MITAAIEIDVLKDQHAVAQIVSPLDASTQLRRHLEHLLAAGRDTVASAQLVGDAEGWVLHILLSGGHSVYHFFDTAGITHRVDAEATALALAGGRP